MLSPQRVVAAASGGAGEARYFPRARSVATPAALLAIVSRRPDARAAAFPRPSVGTARLSLGSVGRRIRVRGLLAGPDQSDAGGAFLRHRLGAAAFGGRALGPEEAVSAPRGCRRPSGPSPPDLGRTPRVGGPGAAFRV